jgi:hypothetical protein
MKVEAPSPQTTLFILLGASEWPYSPAFASSQAFSNAAKRLTTYLLRPQLFGLPSENLLDLFNSSANASEQLEQMSLFLEGRAAILKASQNPVRDVIVCFIGHGGFVGHDSDFYLVHRRTNVESLRASGISIAALADILLDKARHVRRYLLLDCCFAAAAFKSFQGGPDQVALTKTLDAFHVPTKRSGFPGRGTVLLCSSDQKTPSLLLPDESCTMFSWALLEALVRGNAQRSEYLSLREVKELALDLLVSLPDQNAPRPALLSPDQSEGDVADIPFFPNPGLEKERLRLSDLPMIIKERLRLPGLPLVIPVETPAPPLSPQERPEKQILYQQPKVPPQSAKPSAYQSPSVVVGKRSLRRSIPHPWLLGMCLLNLLLVIGTVVLASSYGASSGSFVVLVFLILLVSWISSAVIAARGRNWVWLVVLILTFGLALPFFSIFAQPKKGALPSTTETDAPPPQQPSLEDSSQSDQPSAQAQENNQQGPQHPWGATLKGSEQSLGLGSSPVNIGRSPQNQLILNDLKASKVHAQIYAQGQNHILVDMGSANGTFVNEQKLLPNTPHLLNVDDRVRIGQTVFIYTSRDSLEDDNIDVDTDNTVML